MRLDGGSTGGEASSAVDGEELEQEPDGAEAAHDAAGDSAAAAATAAMPAPVVGEREAVDWLVDGAAGGAMDGETGDEADGERGGATG